MVADFTASRLSFLVTWPNIKASINLYNPPEHNEHSADLSTVV